MKYVQRYDGEGFFIPLCRGTGVMFAACCNCGYVHKIAFVPGKKKLGIAAKHDEKETIKRQHRMRKRKEGIFAK